MHKLIDRYRQSINPPYRFKDYLNLFFTVLIFLTLPITILIVNQSQTQDLRTKAEQVTVPRVPTIAVPDEIIVKFKKEVPEEDRDNVRKKHKLVKDKVIESKDEEEVIENTPEIDNETQVKAISTVKRTVKKNKLQIELVKVPAGERDKIIEDLWKNPNVEYAEPNYLGQLQIVPNDPSYSSQWNLTQVQAQNAWDITTGEPSIIVAVLDSGVKAEHLDLTDKLVPGYNFYDNNSDTSDVDGHGTAVAGVVGASTNNNLGIASLGYNTKIMPLRVGGKGGDVSYSAGISGIIYAADHGTKVINMSWGGGIGSDGLEDAVNYAWNRGLVLVGAAGNYTVCCVLYPAAYDNVIAAGATKRSGERAKFSSIGDKLDVMAPGEGVYTTQKNGTYDDESGTSFASPHVAALAALIFAANTALTNQQVVDIITSTAEDMGNPGWDDQTGFGKINAAAALARATGNQIPSPAPSLTQTPTLIPTPGGSDTIPPTVSITSPANGATVSGTVAINVAAIDNVGLNRVEFKIDGRFLINDKADPYVVNWNTTQYTNGPHTILIRALDLSNNKTESTITVTVNN